MKTKPIILMLFISFTMSNSAFANFVSAKVKVTGVTCSMCSNSIHKALSTLPFIDKIEVDLENVVFALTFKQNQIVIIDDIKNKIEGAGFSVSELIADFKFQNSIIVSNDYHFEYENNIYHFITVSDQKLNDLVSLHFIDKGFTSNKNHKKYLTMTKHICIKTGKPHHCCESISNKRMYHVTV